VEKRGASVNGWDTPSGILAGNMNNEITHAPAFSMTNFAAMTAEEIAIVTEKAERTGPLVRGQTVCNVNNSLLQTARRMVVKSTDRAMRTQSHTKNANGFPDAALVRAEKKPRSVRLSWGDHVHTPDVFKTGWPICLWDGWMDCQHPPCVLFPREVSLLS
jgi:hypothetical protein